MGEHRATQAVTWRRSIFAEGMGCCRRERVAEIRARRGTQQQQVSLPCPDSKGSAATSASGSWMLPVQVSSAFLVGHLEGSGALLRDGGGGLMFYSNIREGGIEEKGSRMSTKKIILRK